MTSGTPQADNTQRHVGENGHERCQVNSWCDYGYEHRTVCGTSGPQTFNDARLLSTVGVHSGGTAEEVPRG